MREFKAELDKIFVQNEEYSNFIITVMSFGFKYGIPRDSDIVQDVRFLPIRTMTLNSGRKRETTKRYRTML